jgi:DNA-binding CsgD family transcriptional regulator
LEELERVLEDAQRAGLVEQAGLTYLPLVDVALDVPRYDVAANGLAKGLEYCSDHGLELFRLYLLSFRARLDLVQGRWAQAADTAGMVLRIPRTSISPRITALTVLGLVRARRGDPGHRPLLDEAWGLARPTGEVGRLGPVAAARAEAAWCPYEAALCLADADDEVRPRLALNELLGLEARPAAAIVARRLRERGVMSLPRGPRATTRQNQYGLTLRELEVLALVDEGLQNGQIADRLVVSVRTVDHHVEAILRKLGARTRADARATATSLGIAVAAC